MYDQIKENRLRGSAAFPFALYEMPHGDTALSAALHWQDDVEVLSVNRGEVALTLDSAQLLLHAGEVVWINPGQLHGFQGLTPDAHCDVFIFPLQHLLFSSEDHDQQSFLRPLAEGKLGFPPRLPPDTDCGPLLRQVIALQKAQPPAYELLTKALLLQLISRLAQADAFVRLLPARHDDICKRILTYVHEHYAEKITVRDAAEAAAISPTYFSAFFLKHFFMTFTDYLRHYRIEQVCAMLKHTSLSVTEIALAAGFNSASHMIQHFRRAKGITPLMYRRAGDAAGSRPSP